MSLRTRPYPRAVDGMGEGQALGKRGLHEDRRLRVFAIHSGVWGQRKLALRVAQCAGAAGWSGPGTRPGRFFFFF